MHVKNYLFFILICSLMTASQLTTIKSQKLFFDWAGKGRTPQSHGKAIGFYSVELKLDDPSASTSELNDQFVLTAQLRNSASFPQVNFQWILPADVELIDGNINGKVDTNEVEQVSIKVRNHSTVDQQIRIEIFGFESGERNGHVAVFNTQSTRTLQADVENIKRKNEFLNSQGFSQKVMQ